MLQKGTAANSVVLPAPIHNTVYTTRQCESNLDKGGYRLSCAEEECRSRRRVWEQKQIVGAEEECRNRRQAAGNRCRLQSLLHCMLHLNKVR